jgi:hypothetical protein
VYADERERYAYDDPANYYPKKRVHCWLVFIAALIRAYVKAIAKSLIMV